MKHAFSMQAVLVAVTLSMFSPSASATMSLSNEGLPSRIVIVSEHGGLEGRERTDVEIVADGHRFRFATKYSESEVYREERRAPPSSGFFDAAKVRALLTALGVNPVRAPDLDNLGITKEWLEQRMTDDRVVLNEIAGSAPNQEALFRATFTDLKFIDKHILETLSSYHTDDHPFVDVSIVFAHGKTVHTCASGQHPFMLPWVISGSCAHFDADAGPRTVSYNAQISSAVAALLPTDSTNRGRLHGDRLADELAEMVMYSIADRWKLLDAENKAGDALERLRSRYSVIDGEIGNFHHPEYGTYDPTKPYEVATQTAEQNLHATLAAQQLPPNLTYALVLQYTDGRVLGVDEFLRNGDTYGAQVLAVPWLAAFIRRHSDVPFRISYVHRASVGDKALRTFRADMHALGRDGLVDEVWGAGSRAILLIVGSRYSEAYWILLPDRSLILWRFGGPTGLLKWSPRDFEPKDCGSTYQEAFGGCVGAVVSPMGVLVR